MAQARLAAAQAELERQQSALESVNEAVMFSMNADASESEMLFDAVDVVIKEAQEAAEPATGIITSDFVALYITSPVGAIWKCLFVRCYYLYISLEISSSQRFTPDGLNELSFFFILALNLYFYSKSENDGHEEPSEFVNVNLNMNTQIQFALWV